MFDDVPISPKSMTLLEQLQNSGIQPNWDLANNRVSRAILVTWLNQTPAPNSYNEKKYHFLLQSLYASLLEDLNHAFLTPAEREAKQPKIKKPWYKSLKFMAVMLAGILISLCEGFDGIASVFGLIASVTIPVALAVSAAFAVLSVTMFCLINLVSISKSMNVSLKQSRHLLDLCVENVEQINQLEQVINKRYLQRPVTALNLQALRSMTLMLQTRHTALNGMRAGYRDQINGLRLKITKKIAAVTTGTILALGVFFACQTLSVAIGGLFIASVAATFWPIALACSLMSVIAFAFFWKRGRPELEEQVAHWAGLDHEQIEAFSGEEVVIEERAKLDRLKNQIEVVEELMSQRENPPEPGHRAFPLLTPHNPPDTSIIPLENEQPFKLETELLLS